MTATFKLFKECGGSRRFRTTDEDFPIRDIYVKRPYANTKLELTLTIEEDETYSSSKGFQKTT